MANAGRVFPLTGLQIGDLQSYLSHLCLFLAGESGKIYILVDNRPWLKDLVSRSAHLWQLMVTKSRLSPFANTRGKKARKLVGELPESRPSSPSNRRKTTRSFRKLFSLIHVVMLSRKRALLPVKKLRNSLIANSKLHRILYGFIVFEVAWSDVRGINYLNELQTDTSLAIETKFMRRWEFDCISQAASCISSWFPGTLNEQILLKAHLDAMLGEVFQEAQESFSSSTEDYTDDIVCQDLCLRGESPCFQTRTFCGYPTTTEDRTDGLHTPPPRGPYKRRKVINSTCSDAEVAICTGEEEAEPFEILSQTSDPSEAEVTLDAIIYRDVLILFRFNDPHLPFKLKATIMSDLRLLTLLEAGLPSWVIFLQSYPGFCHLYRPWMCPLARALYVVVSIGTVLIGFYDLYKNVPMLKATASSLFGPLFDWIETWDMVSRIKYLGTMLFLHNSKKAIEWFLMVTRTISSSLSFITKPLAGPFVEFFAFVLPLWSTFVKLVDSFISVTWMAFESSITLIGDLLEILLLPIWYIVLVLWNVATSISLTLVSVLGEVLYAPVRLLLGFSRLLSLLYTITFNMVGDIWLFTSGIFQFTRGVESTVSSVSSYEVSMWRSLWNDLFSQVFRALRSILNGFVAFFTACNRHRLSIYNHVKEVIQRLSCAYRRGRLLENGRGAEISEVQITPRFQNEPRLFRHSK